MALKRFCTTWRRKTLAAAGFRTTVFDCPARTRVTKRSGLLCPMVQNICHFCVSSVEELMQAWAELQNGLQEGEQDAKKKCDQVGEC